MSLFPLRKWGLSPFRSDSFSTYNVPGLLIWFTVILVDLEEGGGWYTSSLVSGHIVHLRSHSQVGLTSLCMVASFSCRLWKCLSVVIWSGKSGKAEMHFSFLWNLVSRRALNIPSCTANFLWGRGSILTLEVRGYNTTVACCWKERFLNFYLPLCGLHHGHFPLTLP